MLTSKRLLPVPLSGLESAAAPGHFPFISEMETMEMSFFKVQLLHSGKLYTAERRSHMINTTNKAEVIGLVLPCF